VIRSENMAFVIRGYKIQCCWQDLKARGQGLEVRGHGQEQEQGLGVRGLQVRVQGQGLIVRGQGLGQGQALEVRG